MLLRFNYFEVMAKVTQRDYQYRLYLASSLLLSSNCGLRYSIKKDPLSYLNTMRRVTLIIDVYYESGGEKYGS